MAETPRERDHLFQLNVLIWASFPQPEGAPYSPVLLNKGYHLYSVEQPLHADLAELASINSSNPRVHPNPVADVTLYNRDTEVVVLMECKPSSFSVESDRCPQVRGLLVAGASIRKRVPIGGLPSAEVCCIVPLGDVDRMAQTLRELTQQVTEQGLSVCPAGPLGVSIKSDGIYLGVPRLPECTGEIPRQLCPERKVLSVEPDEAPRPLYVVPWMPGTSCDDDYYAFREKVRQYVLVWLGGACIGTTVSLPYDRLLDGVSRGIFSLWRDRASLRGQVFPEIMRIASVLFGADVRVAVGKTKVSVTLAKEADRDELMDRVRTARVSGALPGAIQASMDELLTPSAEDEDTND